MIDVLIVHSRAKSHEKVAHQIASYLSSNKISYFIQKITDEPIRDIRFKVGLFVVTFDRLSINEIAKFFPHVNRKILYTTVEGIPIIDRSAHKLLDCVDEIIANSEFTREMLELLGYHPSKLIYHEAKTVSPHVDTAITLRQWKGNDKVVLWVGMNQKRKGLDQLAEITRRVAEIRDDVKFLVVTGLGEFNLKSLGFSMNTRVDIRIGALSEEELASYYIISDVVISTSYCEGFGMTINEALAYGKKVLTPKYKPFTEYVWYTANVKDVYYVNYMNYMLFKWHVLDIDDFVDKLIALLDSNISTGKPILNTYTQFVDIVNKYL